MNLNQVQVFCAVAKHLSFSMAAEELFITQPAVSQQVKALERQLNVKLFERVGHKLYLTEAGEGVLPHAQALLTTRAEMEQTLAMLRGSARGRLALGANTTGGMYVAPGIVRAFRDVSPEVEATLQIETTNRILDRVMQNMIDVALVTGPVEDGRFAIRDLCPDEVELIVSPSHPFAGRASVSPAEVAAEDFAVPEPGSRTRTLIEQAFLERGHRLRVTMQLPGTEAVKKAVEANVAVAMVSRYSVGRELSLGALARVPIEGLVLERPIHILHRKGKHLSPLVRRFLTFASEYVAEEEGTLKRIRK
jgi:LysR family transcriptional regulator, low CO2-responsive transcriptional regulator